MTSNSLPSTLVVRTKNVRKMVIQFLGGSQFNSLVVTLRYSGSVSCAKIMIPPALVAFF